MYLAVSTVAAYSQNFVRFSPPSLRAPHLVLILPRGDVVQWALLSERERRGEYEECDEYHFCFPEARLVDEMGAGVPDLSPL